MSTPSEALVTKLCSRSFLSLWTEPNPVKKPGKELCDVIVVCGDDVIIFSVKEIALQDAGGDVAAERWRRRAIEESAKQLYGAERWVRTASRVVRADGSPGVVLPSPGTIRVHRVAVALGSRARVPFEQGDFDRGFVHVLDENGLDRVLGELDTVTDFVAYLAAKEARVASGPVYTAAEEDVLAVYLHRGRKFPEADGPLTIRAGAWEELVATPEWKRRKDADQVSRTWDRLIETFHELVDHGLDGRERSPEEMVDHLDGALRAMAREDRLSRRMLATAFLEFMREAETGAVSARMVPSPSGVVYVFLASARDEDRAHRQRELALRCLVARGLNPASQTVVGIATERYLKGGGFSLDGYSLTKPTWTEQDQAALEGIQRDLGYFRAPRTTRASVDEYP